jgi:hypothetical protein
MVGADFGVVERGKAMTEVCWKCRYVLKIPTDESSDVLLYCHRFTAVPTPFGYLDV